MIFVGFGLSFFSINLRYLSMSFYYENGSIDGLD